MAQAAFGTPKPVKWWVPLVIGIVAIIVGLLFFMRPVATSATAVFLLGAYWLVLGIVELIGLFRDRTAWGWKLFMGIIAILAGGVILSGFIQSTRLEMLATTMMVGIALAWVIGFLAIIYGIVALIAAFRGGGWVPGILGVLGIIFGIIIAFGNTLIAAASLPFALGIVLLFEGVILIIQAFRIRSA